MTHKAIWQYVTVQTLRDGKLVMSANTEEAARPWLRLLENAGVDVERTPNGNYSFTLTGRPDLIAGEVQP